MSGKIEPFAICVTAPDRGQQITTPRLRCHSRSASATPGGCVRGQGYWKNHPSAWPVTELQLGNVTYTQQQLLDILHQPVRGNGLLILAHQLIAALLNIANADPSCIQTTIDEANALIGDLVVPPIGNGYLAPRDAAPLAGILGQFNEGFMCAPKLRPKSASNADACFAATTDPCPAAALKGLTSHA
jgi:hypothetical protein